MKKIILCAALLLQSFYVDAAQTCNGQFMNPISDVCWDCAFPIKLFGQKIGNGDGEDYDSAKLSGIDKIICSCRSNIGLVKTGFPVSFWEFARQVDVTRTPYCLVGLGARMDISVNGGMDGNPIKTTDATFRHVHWYVNPLLGLMGAVLDAKCLEPKGFDLAYVSELDPSWVDEEMARLLTPDAYLFSNFVAQLACGADCIAASAGLTTVSNTMFWCAGCNGVLYPLDGWSQGMNGGVQMSALITHRITAKMHRMLTQTSASGKDAMCGNGKIEPVMDKRQYKFSMVFPVPQAEIKDNGIGGGGKILSCCQPFGRTTALWGSGREIPFKGEDFSYGIFRKRDCCQ